MKKLRKVTSNFILKLQPSLHETCFVRMFEDAPLQIAINIKTNT